MYRDDMEALKARVEVLESTANAERKAREAAEAAANAARARADELTLLLERTRDEPDPPFLRRHGLTVAALLVAIVAVVAFIWQHAGYVSAREDREALHRDLASERALRARAEDRERSLRRLVSQLQSDLLKRGPPGNRGTLDRSAIKKVVAAHMAAVQRCYEAQLLRNPELAGKIVFEWIVGADGTVVSPRQVSSSMRSPATASCILAQLRTWRFPRPVGGSVQVRYPFIFRSSDDPEGPPPTPSVRYSAQKGYLLVSTKPPARIIIDGRDTDRMTPTPPSRPVELGPGRHRVTLEAPGGKRYIFAVTIRPGTTTKLIKVLPD